MNNYHTLGPKGRLCKHGTLVRNFCEKSGKSGVKKQGNKDADLGKEANAPTSSSRVNA